MKHNKVLLLVVGVSALGLHAKHNRFTKAKKQQPVVKHEQKRYEEEKISATVRNVLRDLARAKSQIK